MKSEENKFSVNPGSKVGTDDLKKETWEPMKLTYAGEARDIVKGGTGKQLITQADMGDTNKPKGQG